MSDMNNVVLTGRAGHDPESRHTRNGTHVVNLRLASNQVFYQNQQRQERTTWATLTFWAAQADTAARWIRKGDRIGITGELQEEEFTDRHNNKRSVTKIKVRSLHFLGGANSGDGEEPAREPDGGGAAGGPPPSDDDIPF